ncbi:MAG: GNAT family N-acetyltransferase [Deltaproteobacteria bacterium]|nr:GNAT family N-acetyltransferase [Deltaproteobacteria bacterium]
MEKPVIVTFDSKTHCDEVVSLWKKVFGDQSADIAPDFVLDKELEAKGGLIFIALKGELIVGTIMAGYDGNRGWIYGLGVLPEYQRQGIGSSLLAFVEKKLSALGCRKINLQMMEGDEASERFFAANGYRTERRINMGKKLSQGVSRAESLRTRAKLFAKALDEDDFESARMYLSRICQYSVGKKELHGPETIIQSFREGSDKAKRLFDQVDYGSETLRIEGNRVTVQFTDLIQVKGQSLVYSSRQHLEFGEDGLIVRIVHEEIPGELEALQSLLKRLGVA